MKKIFWSSEKLLSFTAIFISVCTLFVFLYQTNLIRKQQYASVFPYDHFGHYGMNSEGYKFCLTNDGIGPAIITTINIEDKAGNVYEDVESYVHSQLTAKDSVRFFYAHISIGSLIQEKGSLDLIGNADEKLESSKRLADVLDSKNVSIEVGYQSIYKEKWITRNGQIAPEKI